MKRPVWRLAFLASVPAAFLAASAAPTPLYPIYQTEWSLSVEATSLVFGVYALSLLCGLVVFARLSDHLGRRPVMWAALAIQIVALALFVAAADVDWLLCARVLQGLSTGVGLSAVGAALLDTDVRRGTVANAAAPPFGSAAGAMGAALLAQFGPAPTRLVYLVLIGVLVAQAIGLLFVPDGSARRPGVWASLRPRVGAPRNVRLLLVAACPVLFSVWAVSGLFGGLGPKLTAELSGSSSPILGALPIAIVGAVSPIVAFATSRLPGRVSLACGIAGLVVGGLVVVAAVVSGIVGLLLGAAAIAGVAFGLGFRGGMQLVLPAVGQSERAGTLSLLYVASYLGFGLPVIVAGVVTARTGDLLGTTLGYVAVLLLLAVASALALGLSRRAALEPEESE
ncbi:MFS transporter [Gordonia sp. DT219]|uniref:MFS transporter n=1 Tax=Gordonia sp. DT219 TaxID=3416658 RepID=UPI003CEE5587